MPVKLAIFQKGCRGRTDPKVANQGVETGLAAAAAAFTNNARDRTFGVPS